MAVYLVLPVTTVLVTVHPPRHVPVVCIMMNGGPAHIPTAKLVLLVFIVLLTEHLWVLRPVQCVLLDIGVRILLHVSVLFLSYLCVVSYL